LDIGCGNGRMVIQWAFKVERVWGGVCIAKREIVGRSPCFGHLDEAGNLLIASGAIFFTGGISAPSSEGRADVYAPPNGFFEKKQQDVIR
jgi:hypothetical protein